MSRKEEKGNRRFNGTFWNDIRSKYEYTVFYYDTYILQFMVDSKLNAEQESGVDENKEIILKEGSLICTLLTGILSSLEGTYQYCQR